MPQDHTLEVDLEIFLSKPFTTEAIPAFAAAAPFIAQLRESLLTRRWPEMRAVIRASYLDLHVERLARQLDAADPGLVAFLDAHVDAVRSASRVLPDFKARVYVTANPTDIRSYMYWKYSRDVLGKPAGLTQTALQRQLGLDYLSAPVLFRFPCPNCGADAECEANGVGELAPDMLMRCGACGHADRHCDYRCEAVAPHVLCDCSCCVAETLRAGAGLERLQWELVPALASRMRAEIAGIAANSAAAGRVDPHAEAIVRDFAAMWTAVGKGSFAEAVNAWVRRYPRMFLTHAYYEQAWKLIDALAGARAVSIEVTQRAEDDQGIIEDLVLYNAARSLLVDAERKRAEDEQATALAGVLMGFSLDRPGSLADWLRAESELGLFDNWFALPCQIVCCLDPLRLVRAGAGETAAPARQAAAPAPELQAAIALLRAHGYRVDAPPA